eukprot:COSAG02_NODE_36159_length_458_cov_0.863510_1_plen_82_part_01
MHAGIPPCIQGAGCCPGIRTNSTVQTYTRPQTALRYFESIGIVDFFILAGEPNAKYWTVRLLASVFGKRTRQLVQTNISSSD